jgi:hypothetical protein
LARRPGPVSAGSERQSGQRPKTSTGPMSGTLPRGGIKRRSVRETLTSLIFFLSSRNRFFVLLTSCCLVGAPAIFTGHALGSFSFLFLSTPVRALTRALKIETALVSRHHMDPSCALSALDLMVAWSFVYFLLMCRLGMNSNPSTPVVFHRACASG